MKAHDNWDQHWNSYADAASRNPAQQMRHSLIERILRKRDEERSMRFLDRACPKFRNSQNRRAIKIC